MRIALIAVVLLGGILVSPAVAQDGIFSRLNPFRQAPSSDEDIDSTTSLPQLELPEHPGIDAPVLRDDSPSPYETTEATILDESPPRGFRLPSLPEPRLPSLPKPKLPSLPKFQLPKFSMPSPPPPDPNKPSTLQRLNSGTKAFFTKTRATLMPWTNDPSDSESNRSATRRIGTRGSSQPSKPTLFRSIFPSSPEEQPIETVNDYLQQPRPSY